MRASRIIKRSIVLNGHKTSVSLEDEFWEGLREIAAKEGIFLTLLVAKVDDNRTMPNLSSALRVYVLQHYRRSEA